MDKENPGKVSKSTRFLIDTLKEEALPDHLLSPDSLVRKKREDKKIFNELCYLVMVKSILLYRDILAFLDKQIKKNREKEVELDKIRHLPILNEIQLAGLGTKLPNYLTEQQLAQLANTKQKSEWLGGFLDTRINELSEMVKAEETKIKTLENKIDETRHGLADDWKNHFDRYVADPDFESITVPLFSTEAASHQDHIKISKEKYLDLSNEIANELRENAAPIIEVDNFFKNIIDKFMDKELNEQLSLPYESKANLIKKIIEHGGSPKYLAEYILHDASHNAALIEKFDELCQQQKSLAESVLRKEAAERCLSDTKAIKEINNSLLESCNRILGIKPDPDKSGEKIPPAVNTLIEKGGNLADMLIHQANDVQSKLSSELIQVDVSKHQTNNLLDRLNALRAKTNLSLQQNKVEKPNEVINSFDSLLNQSKDLLDKVKLGAESKSEREPAETSAPTVKK